MWGFCLTTKNHDKNKKPCGENHLADKAAGLPALSSLPTSILRLSASFKGQDRQCVSRRL
ncbi:MAG: hypothetical protein EB015_12510 [Methylocystaceae bacterium]|nr:hypothetical protein [Methylocystaceae bacterium]